MEFGIQSLLIKEHITKYITMLYYNLICVSAMNLLRSNLQCVECNCTKLIKDNVRQEIYCSKCGLVLVDNTLPTLNQRENFTGNDNQSKKDCFKLKRLFYHMNFTKDR